jgi:hypothetical protein
LNGLVSDDQRTTGLAVGWRIVGEAGCNAPLRAGTFPTAYRSTYESRGANRLGEAQGG